MYNKYLFNDEILGKNHRVSYKGYSLNQVNFTQEVYNIKQGLLLYLFFFRKKINNGGFFHIRQYF